ncbi:MAG: hypothetical protein M3070_14310 [Actinomycetota bacterium]|nr:hypothetical protein [Actinomycetota bacterium]
MATAQQTKTNRNAPAGFDLPSVDEATERIRDLNERVITSSKSAGLVALDAYEKALHSLVDFEEKVASASQLEWVSALASTHAKFIADVGSSYTKAARDLLK